VLAAALAVAAPLAGLALAGQPVAAYARFPPRTEYVAHAPFSWTAFALLAVPAIAALGLFARGFILSRPSSHDPGTHGFPWWGWIGVALAGAGWIVAWREGLAPAEWRRQSFTVLWLGYILAMNALAWRRAGRSPLTHRTAWFLWLFPASAAAWWLFEYLNQFVDNWHYAGIAAGSDWDYFLQGTLPFSTVLPALASTWAWLATFPRLEGLSLPAVRGHRAAAWAALAAGVAILAGLGLWPEMLFSGLWVAPLLLVAGLQWLLTGESFFAPLARGDWRCVLQPAAAALVCGFFWELWNFGSLAKWHYSIPFVQRFHLFEMPLLGYAGYLPFGVGCALLMDLLSQINTPARRRAIVRHGRT
jgi:hypothetical protein